MPQRTVRAPQLSQARCIALEVGELAVLLAEALVDAQRVAGERLGRLRLIGAHHGLGMLEIGDRRGPMAVDLEERHLRVDSACFGLRGPRLGALASR